MTNADMCVRTPKAKNGVTNMEERIKLLKIKRDKGFLKVASRLKAHYQSLGISIKKRDVNLKCCASILIIYLIIVESYHGYKGSNKVYHELLTKKIRDVMGFIRNDISLEKEMRELYLNFENNLEYAEDDTLFRSSRSSAYISAYKNHNTISDIYYGLPEFHRFSNHIDELIENGAFKRIFHEFIIYLKQRISLIECTNSKGRHFTTFEFVTFVKYSNRKNNNSKGFGGDISNTKKERKKLPSKSKTSSSKQHLLKTNTF